MLKPPVFEILKKVMISKMKLTDEKVETDVYYNDDNESDLFYKKLQKKSSPSKTPTVISHDKISERKILR